MASRRRKGREDAPRVHFVVKARPEQAVESAQLEEEFTALYADDLAVEPPYSPTELLALAETNAVHGACVEVKSVDSVGHGWTYEPLKREKTVEDDQKAAKAGETVDEQLLAICPEFPFAELLDQARWESEAVGWSAWEVARKKDDPNGEIVGLFALPAHTIRAVPRKKKRKGIWIQIRDARQRYFVEFGSDLRIDPDSGKVARKDEPIAREIIVFRRYSWHSSYYGVPRWRAAFPAGAELAAIREYNVSFFVSGGTVDTTIHVVADNADTANALAAQIKERLSENSGRAHTIIVTGGGPESKILVQSLRASTEGKREGHFSERRDDLVKEFLMVHQVPPYRIGLAEVGSLAGNAAREMLRAYRYGAIEPGQALIETRLERTLFGPRGLDLKARGIRWVLRDLDWEQLELDQEAAWQGVESGVLTPNDAREKLRMARKNEKVLDLHYMHGVPLVETPPASETTTPRKPGTPAEPGATSREEGTPPAPEEEEEVEKARRRAKAGDVDRKRTPHIARARPALQQVFRASKKKWARLSVAGAESKP